MTLGLRSLKALYFVFHNLGDFWLTLFYFICLLPDLRRRRSDRITKIDENFRENRRWIDAISVEVVIQSETPLKTLPPHVVFCFVFLLIHAPEWRKSCTDLKVFSSELDVKLRRRKSWIKLDEKVVCASAQSTSVSRFIDLWNVVEVVNETSQAGHNFLEGNWKGIWVKLRTQGWRVISYLW